MKFGGTAGMQISSPANMSARGWVNRQPSQPVRCALCSGIKNIVDKEPPSYSGCPSTEYPRRVTASAGPNATFQFLVPSARDVETYPNVDCLGSDEVTLYNRDKNFCLQQAHSTHSVNALVFLLPQQQCFLKRNCSDKAIRSESHTLQYEAIELKEIVDVDEVAFESYKENSVVHPSNPPITLRTVSLPIGKHSLVYEAFDSEFNRGVCCFNIIVEDNGAPVFENCNQNDVSATADSSSGTATVNWEVPVATDNSGEDVTVEASPDKSPGSEFSTGSHSIVYTGTDSSGNQATCTINIHVEG